MRAAKVCTAALLLLIGVGLAACTGEPSAVQSSPAASPGSSGEPDAAIDPDTPLSEPALDDPGEEVDVEPLPPVEVAEAADFGNGLIATVSEVRELEVEARQPGETAGPAVAVYVKVRNAGDHAFDVNAIVVNAVDSAGDPLIPNFTEPFEPLEGELAPGESKDGVYIFRLDGDPTGVSILLHHDTTPHYIVVTT